MTHWKFLEVGGRSPFAGFDWAGTAGGWVTAEDLRPCRSGIHACRIEDLPHWLAPELWVIELDDPVPVGHKVQARRGRLGARVDDWDAAAERALAVSCIARTALHAAAELRAVGLAASADDLDQAASRPSDADALSAAAAAGTDAAQRLGARAAVELTLYVADVLDYLESCPAATIAYIAARAAGRRTDLGLDVDGYGDERRWQADWLADRLGLAEAGSPPVAPAPG
jgi:hypothetical protein